MNRQEAIKTVFDTLNAELIKPGKGSDTMAVAVIDALGWPDPVTEPKVTLVGFQIIDSMSNEEIVDEVLVYQRKQWLKASRNKLKKLLVTARMVDYQERLIAEAKFAPEFGNGGLWGLLGGGNVTTDE